MAYRYSDTLKWQDEWFVDLKTTEKLLFIYLCDNCDIAGFFEISNRRICFDLGIKEADFIGALKGLERGLIISDDNKCLLVKNFIRHQKNLPINSANKSHIGILKRFDLYSKKFIGLELDYEKGYNYQGACKPLQRGTGNNIPSSSKESLELFVREEFSFNEFWSMYPNKTGKVDCEKRFDKLSLKDKIRIKETLPLYAKNKPFEGYNFPNPSTYLNQKRYEDDIIEKDQEIEELGYTPQIPN